MSRASRLSKIAERLFAKTDCLCLKDTTANRRLHFFRSLLFTMVIFYCAFSPGKCSSTLQVVADPPRLPADGQAASTIIVQVQDDTGRPVADGTIVNFSTTLGTITPASGTVGGVARAKLTSASLPGTAIVSALLADARSDIEVDFFPQAAATQNSSSVITLQGEQLVFNRETGNAIGSDSEFKQGAITISARAMQCNMAGVQLSAQGEVIVSNGKESIVADALVYAARRGQGSLLRYEGDKAAVYTFFAPDLKEQKSSTEDLDQFQPMRDQESRNMIAAKKISARSDGRIVFDNAAMMLDGTKVISLPHFAINPASADQGFFDQVVRINSGFGLSADFPYYYAATPGRIGLLSITHNLSPEGALVRSGIGLNLEEQYFMGEKGQGTLNLDDLAGPANGFRWTNSYDFSSAFHSFASVRYTKFDANSPRVLDASATLSRSLPKMSLDLSLLASSYSDSKQYSAALSARTYPQKIGASRFTYSMGLRMGYLRASAYVLDTSEEGTTLVSNIGMKDTLSQCLSLNFAAPKWDLDKRTSVDSSLALSNAWNQGATSQVVSASASLRRKLGATGNLRLSYIGSLACAGANLAGGRHQQSLNGNFQIGRQGRWDMSGFSSYMLESQRFFNTWSARYFPKFQSAADGSPQWAMSVTSVLTGCAGTNTSDLRASLARILGGWELSFNYSPHGSDFGSGFLGGSSGLLGVSGYGYTQDIGRTMWLEIRPRTF